MKENILAVDLRINGKPEESTYLIQGLLAYPLPDQLTMVFYKFFKKKKVLKVDPGIRFGRYSDNNKSVEKVNKWNQADSFFRQQKYLESLDAFFEYLRDDELQNVSYERKGEEGTFEIFQGSKIIHGRFNHNNVYVEAGIASMPVQSIPVMRKLLELNFHLYYSRFALSQDRLCIRFDSDLNTANPNKLYFGLRELATRADKQDDLLVQEFASLIPIDTEHITEMPVAEKEIRFRYMMKWLEETLKTVEELDPEKFSGGISYLILTLAFRIDYLITPEGKLLNELEKVVNKYFKKDDRPASEKNTEMIEGLIQLKEKTREEVYPYFFRSKNTFSIVSPENHKSVADSIQNAVQSMYWYRDNNYRSIANVVMEYGMTYNHFSYSLPGPVTALLQLFMRINHGEYFRELGFAPDYYNAESNQFMDEEIVEEIRGIVNTWKPKYPKLEFNSTRLRFTSITDFNLSFCNEVAALNLNV